VSYFACFVQQSWNSGVIRRKVLVVKLLLAVTMLMMLSVGANAQEHPPDLLVHAAQCLAAKDFLAPSKSTALNFGYLIDEKSHPGDQVIYIVEYKGSSRSKGWVFVVFLKQQDRRQVFNIQNNGTFVRSKSGVNFTGEPLGGVWTHQHLVSAIKRIEQQSRFTIPTKDLATLSTLINCESYTDNLK
jgi:hypothetical protein